MYTHILIISLLKKTASANSLARPPAGNLSVYVPNIKNWKNCNKFLLKIASKGIDPPNSTREKANVD